MPSRDQSATSQAAKGSTLRRGLPRVMMWETLLFFERNLERGVVREAEVDIPLEVRQATDHDFERFAEFFTRQRLTSDRIARRLERGDECFLAVFDRRAVHYTWLAHRRCPIPELGLEVIVEPGEVYIYDAFTDAAMRGHGVQPAVVSFCGRYERSRGLKRLTYFIRQSNTSALKIVGKQFEGAPTLTRRLRVMRVRGVPGRLVVGLDRRGPPALAVAPTDVAFRLGPLGHWVRPRRVAAS